MLVDINLLPQKERDRPAFLIAALSILLVAVIIWAVLFFMARANTAEQNDYLAQSEQIAAEQAILRAEIEQTSGLNEEQQLQATVDWAVNYQYDTVPLLNEMVSILPERGFFNSFSYIAPNQATLTLQFDTTREAAYYLTQLKASDLIASATLDSVANQAVDTAVVEGEEIPEDAMLENPRYLATYSIVFVDERIPAEGTAEGEVVDGEVVAPPAEEVPAETAPVEETPVEETPVEEAPATDADAVPAETEGDLR